MRGELSLPSPTPTRPLGGEMVLVRAPKPLWVAGLPEAGLIGGQSKVGMIEGVEELGVEAKGDVLRDQSLLRQVNLAVGEMRFAIVVAARVAEAAVDGRISSRTGTGAAEVTYHAAFEPMQSVRTKSAEEC